ncbi:MAG: phosphate uptake regulator PhoU [Candidatus Caldarchaeum sp.]
MEVYTRRIQRTGRSTYVVSLPKQWVEANKLSRFDQLKLTVIGGGVLIAPDRPRDVAQAEIMAAEENTPLDVVRLIFSKYLAGYSRIKVVFPSYAPATISYLKEVIRRWLVGVEIVEESARELVAQCIPMHDSLPVKTSVERMAGITANMVKDAVSAFTNGDLGLAEEVIKRDDEVDRFYHFVVRQLNIAVKDYTTLRSLELNDPSECIVYALVAKNIERAADHAVSICKHTVSLKSYQLEGHDFSDLAEEITNVFKRSLQSLLNSDLRLASKTLEMAAEGVLKLEALARRPHNSWVETHYLLVLGSLRRILEYAEDIAEAAVNVSS